MLKDQTNQSSVTSSCPFRDSSCKFVHRPKNARCADVVQLHISSHDLPCHKTKRLFSRVISPNKELFSCIHIGLRFCFLPAILMSFTFSEKNRPCFRCTNKHSQFGAFSHPSPNRIFQMVSPTRGLQVGVRTDFVQEEPPDLRFSTKIWANCVVEELPKYLDILLVVQRDDDKCNNSLRSTKNRFGLHCHPFLCPLVETRPILLEDHLSALRLLLSRWIFGKT